MDHTAKVLITLGVLLLIGLFTDAIGQRTRLPRVTLMLLFGIMIGPVGFNFISPTDEKWFSLVADMALVMIGFLLGEKFTLSSLRQYGKRVLCFSVADVILTALIVLIGLLIIGVPMEIALLLAGIAPATAPAATTDVVHTKQKQMVCLPAPYWVLLLLMTRGD